MMACICICICICSSSSGAYYVVSVSVCKEMNMVRNASQLFEKAFLGLDFVFVHEHGWMDGSFYRSSASIR